jgi:uncharacterized protein involved in exopolysaccharide biosynthesis
MASVGGGMDWEEPGPVTRAEPARRAGLFDLSAAARTVLRRSPRLVLTTILGAGLGYAGWMVWPMRYTATALIMVDPRTPRTSSIEEVLPGIGGDGAAIASIAEIASSDGALVPLVAREKLGTIPELAGRSSGTDADVAANLRRGLKVARRGLTYVIEVTMAARDPDLAARLANLVAEDVVRRQTAIRTEAVTGVSDALGSRLVDLRDTALASERAVSEYRQAHGLLDVASDASVGQRRLTALTQQSAAIRAKLEEAKARWEELRRSGPESGAAAARSEVIVALRTQLTDETRQIAELERTYGPRHPRVDQARQRLATLGEQIRGETVRLADQAKAEIDQITRQLAAVEDDISKRTREELAADQDEVALRDLIRRAQSDRQIYEQFLARQKATREQPGITMPETRVVSSAQPPLKPDKPAVAAVTAVGGFLGLVAGLGWVAASETRRSSPSRPAPTPEPAPTPPRSAPPAPALPSPPEPVAALPRRRFSALFHHRTEAEPGLEVHDDPSAATAPSADAPIPVAAIAPQPTTPAPAADREGAAAAPGDRAGAGGLDPERIYAATGVPVVADVAEIAVRRGPIGEDGEIDLGVVDLRDAITRLSETLLPHLGDRPGAALIVTDVPGAVGRTALALALARRVEEAGFSALIVTDHGPAQEIEPSLADLLGADDPHLDGPPPETAGRVSVIAAAGGAKGGFWRLAADPRLPQVIAGLRDDFDLVVVECPAPTSMAASLAVAATDDVAAVLIVADPSVTGLDRIRDFARLWRRDEERLVMFALSRAGPSRPA